MISNRFQNQESAIASYNYEDIVTGSGLTEFYGIKALVSGSDVFYLTPFRPRTAGYANSGDEHLNFVIINSGTITLDSFVFNAPRIINGIAYFSGGCLRDGAGPHYIKVQLFHVDEAAVETALTDEVFSVTLSGTDIASNYFLAMPLLAQKQIKIGEKIRLKLSVLNTTGNLFFGCDPSDSAFSDSLGIGSPYYTYAQSKMVLYVPFVIDI